MKTGREWILLSLLLVLAMTCFTACGSDGNQVSGSFSDDAVLSVSAGDSGQGNAEQGGQKDQSSAVIEDEAGTEAENGAESVTGTGTGTVGVPSGAEAVKNKIKSSAGSPEGNLSGAVADGMLKTPSMGGVSLRLEVPGSADIVSGGHFTVSLIMHGRPKAEMPEDVQLDFTVFDAEAGSARSLMKEGSAKIEPETGKCSFSYSGYRGSFDGRGEITLAKYEFTASGNPAAEITDFKAV